MKDMVSEKSGEAKADPQVAPSPSASQITPKMREEILARTRASLAAKAGLKSKVFVEFTGEALLLKGTVASPALMEQAEQIARTTLDRYDRSFPMKSQLMVKPTTKHS
jgi:hypothetical protein